MIEYVCNICGKKIDDVFFEVDVRKKNATTDDPVTINIYGNAYSKMVKEMFPIHCHSRCLYDFIENNKEN